MSLQVAHAGIISYGESETPRAVLTTPSVAALSNGFLLATLRTGSSKDSADETVELYRSVNNGTSWEQTPNPFHKARVSKAQSSFRICHITEISPNHLIAASMWIDRQSYPDQPLFNPITEGCLPMGIFLADSYDQGQTWGDWRIVEIPKDVGPPSLTNPILRLSDGTLILSIETNKEWHDDTKWYQRVVFLHSTDFGKTWSEPSTVSFDPSGRIYNWDQRACVSAEDHIATFAWTYDTVAHKYLNLHRRISRDSGKSWSEPEDLGFSDQAAHPAILPDGRVVLAWVDRFKTQSIRARIAPDIYSPFDPASEIVIYQHHANFKKQSANLSDDLQEMGLWTFGLPHCTAMPNGEVFVVYYAGDTSTMDIHFSRIVIRGD